MKNLISNTQLSVRSFLSPRAIVFAAVLIALNVVISRYLSIQTQFLRIGFGFLPVAIFSMMFGPIPGAIAAALGDILGFMLFPSGPYFPGFTFSAFLYGFIYGVFLYKKDISILQIIISNIVVVLLIDLLLNTLWLTILYHTDVKLIIIPRLIKSAIAIPIQVIVILLFNQFIGKKLKNEFKL